MSNRLSTGACARCDIPIEPGGPHYVFTLRMLSGFDGVLQEPEQEPIEEISQIIEESSGLSAEELEDTVDLTRVYTVCPKCRKAILRDPLQRGSVGPSGLLS